MNSIAASLFAVFLALVVALACHGEPESDRRAAALECHLTGRLLLPGGFDRRGMEVHAKVAAEGGELHDTWLLFDEQGRFTHPFSGTLESVTITTGQSAEVYRMDAADLPATETSGQIDLGVIDLRDRLATHRLVVRAGEGSTQGVVRVAMWFRPPPVGPHGGSVALGSRQFPPLELGSEREWLLPRHAQSIYFLVELPADAGRGRDWRSGHQQLFGPFRSGDLPAELFLDSPE